MFNITMGSRKNYYTTSYLTTTYLVSGYIFFYRQEDVGDNSRRYFSVSRSRPSPFTTSFSSVKIKSYLCTPTLKSLTGVSLEIRIYLFL